jgi:LysM repeat protein
MADWSDAPAPGPPPKRFSLATKILAPLALIATLVALYVIINSADEGGKSENVSAKSQGGGDGKSGEKAKGEEEPKTYVVQSGDSLSAIAEKFDISVDEIMRLNSESEIDPQALTPGDELKIR